MAPILERMEARLKEEVGLDVELPSFVDNIYIDITDRDSDNGISIQWVEVEVKRVVREVAEECELPLELDEEDVLHLRKSRKKRNTNRKYVKWLGVIFDDSLDFDIHWKSQLAKARKALGALSGVGGSQWGGVEKGLSRDD